MTDCDTPINVVSVFPMCRKPRKGGARRKDAREACIIEMSEAY